MNEQEKRGERRFSVLSTERDNRAARPGGVIVYPQDFAALPIAKANWLPYVAALGNPAL